MCASIAAVLFASACGGGGDGSSRDDAGVVDHRDGGVAIDASVVPPDAAPPVDWPLSLQVVSGAGRLAGDQFQMDVQIGDYVDQKKMSGGGFTLEGAAVVKPQEGGP